MYNNLISLFSYNTLYKIEIICSFKVWYNSLIKPSGPDAFWEGKFAYQPIINGYGCFYI